mgnify:CR=1 FL=1
MDVCQGHILESTKGTEMELGLYIYLGHTLESTKWIEVKFGTYIDVNKRKCRRQEP